MVITLKKRHLIGFMICFNLNSVYVAFNLNDQKDETELFIIMYKTFHICCSIEYIHMLVNEITYSNRNTNIYDKIYAECFKITKICVSFYQLYQHVKAHYFINMTIFPINLPMTLYTCTLILGVIFRTYQNLLIIYLNFRIIKLRLLQSNSNPDKLKDDLKQIIYYRFKEYLE